MTQDLYNYLTKTTTGAGIIVIKDFDEKVKKYLSKFKVLGRTKTNWVVENKEVIFYVFIPSGNNTRGKRCQHLIIDSRLDDECLHEHVFPMLSHPISRKVEVF